MSDNPSIDDTSADVERIEEINGVLNDCPHIYCAVCDRLIVERDQLRAYVEAKARAMLAARTGDA